MRVSFTKHPIIQGIQSSQNQKLSDFSLNFARLAHISTAGLSIKNNLFSKMDIFGFFDNTFANSKQPYLTSLLQRFSCCDHRQQGGSSTSSSGFTSVTEELLHFKRFIRVNSLESLSPKNPSKVGKKELVVHNIEFKKFRRPQEQ